MRLREDNRGAALVTVLIVVTFISILVTTLLYVAGMNYKTKMVEYQNKMSFYNCETALEEIRAIFVMDVSEASKIAYNKTVPYFATMNTTERENAYKSNFVTALGEIWEARRYPASYTDLEIMQNTLGLTDASKVCVTSVGSWVDDSAQGIRTLQGVEVGFTTSTGYTTYLRTDFLLKAADINWSIENSADYASASDASASQRVDISMEDYVVYSNWTKY